ncbi:hypothetical protein [Microbispora rosea]
MTMVVGWVVAAILAVWFALSVVAQLRVDWVSARRRLDPLGLVPAWNLFAPRPIVTDYLVSYRCWIHDDPADWIRLAVPGPRRWTDALLNTRRRQRKALWTAGHALMWRPDGEHVPILDPSYLLLLGVVTRQVPVSDPSLQVQFRVDCVKGELGGSPERLRYFLSERHVVGRGTDG